jgi:hypothetical protein
MSAGVPAVYLAAVELGLQLGQGNLGEAPPWRYATAGGLGLVLNGADQEREGVAPFVLLLERGGWPVAVVDPGGGCMVGAGPAAEEVLLGELRAELQRLREGGAPTPPRPPPPPPPPRPPALTVALPCVRCGETFRAELPISHWETGHCHECFSWAMEPADTQEMLRRLHAGASRKHRTIRWMRKRWRREPGAEASDSTEVPF